MNGASLYAHHTVPLLDSYQEPKFHRHISEDIRQLKSGVMEYKRNGVLEYWSGGVMKRKADGVLFLNPLLQYLNTPFIQTS